MKLSHKILFLSGCASILLVSPAVAQVESSSPAESSAETSEQALGEILVTARRREENLQKVPVAATVVSSATLQTSGAFTPAQLQTVATGLMVTPFNGDRSNIILTIRGQAYSTGSIFPAVYPYFAEVPLTKLTTGNLYDIENVQVLRGPQGTLFGRVTDGGNVLIQPARPTSELGGYGEVRVGNYDLHAYAGALNLPLVEDKLMVRGAFEVARRDGFSESLTTGQTFDNIHYESFRFSVIAKPTDTIENYTTINYNHANEAGGSAVLQYVNRAAVIRSATSAVGAVRATQIADQLVAELAAQQDRSPYKVTADTIGFDKRRSFWATNNTRWEATDNITAKLILGYVRYKQRVQNDGDGTYIPYSSYLSVLPTSLNNQEQISGEFQVQGSGLDDKLKWTVGTYWDRQQTGSPSETYSGSLGVTRRVTVQSVKTTSKAVYGQVSYEFLRGLTGEGGVRYTEDTSKARTAAYNSLFATAPDPTPHGQCLDVLPPGVTVSSSTVCTPSSAKFNQTTFLASLQWQAADNIFLYAKLSKGYRPGGFNATRVASAYGPEKDYSKEVGIKSNFYVGGVPVRINLAGFYDDFKNTQRFTTFREGTVSTSGVINGKGAKIRGIELEAQAAPIEGLRISANATYLKASYNKNEYSAAEIAAACPADPLTQVPDTTLFCPLGAYARTPKYTYTLDAHYTLPLDSSLGTLTVGGSVYHTAEAWSISTSYINPNVLVPGYEIVNADITWKEFLGSNFDVALFATNLLDNHYLQSVSSGSYLGGSGIGFAMYGEPQMYGLRIRYNFGGK